MAMAMDGNRFLAKYQYQVVRSRLLQMQSQTQTHY